MATDRPLAVKEIKRILKPGGKAYLSLGTYRPISYIGRVEWKRVLEGFTVERSGGFVQPWALVSARHA